MKTGTARLVVFGALALLLCGGTAQAATVLFQNFDAGVTAGWENTTIAGSVAEWTAAAPVFPFVAAHSGANVASFNSFAAPEDESARLASPTLNLTGFLGVTLTFWMYHDTGLPLDLDRVMPQISTDGGAGWSDLSASFITRFDGTEGWRQETFDLSAYAGSPNARLGLLGVSQFGNNVLVDDFEVTANAAVPEPASMALAALGLAALLLRRRRTI